MKPGRCRPAGALPAAAGLRTIWPVAPAKVTGRPGNDRMSWSSRVLGNGQAARAGVAVVSILLSGSAVVAQGPTDAGSRAVLLAPGAFAPDLKPWQRMGQAQFAADGARDRQGRRSARITIGPDVVPAYQQLRLEFDRDIRAGDAFRASVWVRSKDIVNVRGPYLALEFNDAGGQRLAIAHSGAATATDHDGWEQLAAEGTAPSGTRMARLSLVLHAHGTGWFADPELIRTERPVAWPDLGDAPRVVTVRPGQVVQARFGGVGFHAFHHIFPATRTELDEVIVKRWRELRPSFARINHESHWDRRKLDQVAEHLQYMKDAGTELYVTTWDPPTVRTAAERTAYARQIVDQLEYLVRPKGLTNIRYYCMTNEMSLGRWGSLLGDLPTFQAYHQALYDELKARGLPIGLLATDAAPVENWGTLAWAAEHMDPITAGYGGHHYFSDRALDDERVYPWFLGKTRWAVDLARARGKEFLLGEFGSRQDGRTVNGTMRDVCVYFDTPQEPMVALQLAEAAIAAMNAGVYAMGYWTFMDVPDDYAPGYLNKWGLFRCSGGDRSTRAPYYGYALLTRYFRGPGRVVAVETGDPRLRVAALRHGEGPTETWSIAVVNRNPRAVPLRLAFDGAAPSGTLLKYVYDPAHVPQDPFGDLPAPVGTRTLASGRLADYLAAGTLTVYTTRVDTRPPGPVRGLKVERTTVGRDRLTWAHGPEPDLCYYCVFRGKTQLGSTIATSFTAHPGGDAGGYRVVAVDQAGNAGE
jgi:hypothetical protein